MNIRASLRRPFHSPLFALTVFVLVAAVVAVNAVTFGAIYALKWKALPYANGERLVEMQANLQKAGFKIGLAERFREQIVADREHFDGAFGFPSAPSQPGVDDAGRTWRITRVTTDFERVLGVVPALGRGFVADDMRGDSAMVVMLSDAAWRSRFGADPAVIGHSLRIADQPYTVIGVMPPSFAFPDQRTDAWLPLVLSPAEREQVAQSLIGELSVVARLAPDTTLAQARERLSALFAADERTAEPRKNAGLVGAVQPWRERFAASHWRALALLQLAALILLAVVVANLVNLVLDRLLGRAREIGIRRALGAGDSVIARSVIADLAPPLLAGLAIGLAATPFGLRLLEVRGLLPAELPQGSGFGLAPFGAGLAVALLILAGALITTRVLRSSLRLSNRTDASGLGRTRTAMLVGQIMLTTALIGSVGLLLRSAVNLMTSERGFDDRSVLVTSVDAFDIAGKGKVPSEGGEYQQFANDVDALRADIASLPGVRRVAIADIPPFSGGDRTSKIHVPGLADDQQARDRSAGVGYFEALGIGLVAGRTFDPTDGNGTHSVIVDERYVQRYLHDADPLIATVGVPDDQGNFQPARIIGVVHPVKSQRLDEAEGLPMLYRYYAKPYPQFWLLTRADLDPDALAATVRQRVLTYFPDARIGINQGLRGQVAQTLLERRSLIEAIGVFALATLLLAGLGLAAVLRFAIRRRTSELGVRMALGATPARVRNLVMQQGGVLIAMGSVLGLVAGLPLARLLADRLYGVTYTDAQTWLATVAIVAVVALFACWLPARRAAATDPMVALRHE